MTNTNTTAADIRNNIAAIKAAAFGMGHELNAGQAARVAALEAKLAEIGE